MTNTNDTVTRLRALAIALEMGEWIALKETCATAADEIEQLRVQRDEARREVCSMNETGLRMNESDKKREAKRRGWDCFKEKP